MLKRKIVRASKTVQKMLKSGTSGRKYLACKECHDREVEVAVDITAVTCAYCVQRSVAPPPTVRPVPAGEKFPRGWALRARYVHTDGRVFSKGKETGETAQPSDRPLSRQVKNKPLRLASSAKSVSKKKKRATKPSRSKK